MDIKIRPVKSLRGEVHVPGDKSVSHRSVIIGALSSGETEIENFLFGADCISTIGITRALGVEVITENNRVIVRSGGAGALQEPDNILDAGNSGTTMRLMAGVLSGCPFFSVLTGDESLRRRPMARVVKPLTTMGAVISGRNNNTRAPLAICGGNLKAVEYNTPVASAQVKSAVLLAGLFAEGQTSVIEPARSRDHTERMLRYFGADIEIEGLKVSVRGKPELKGKKIIVPGDISSAMFLIAAGVTLTGSELFLPHVGVNPTRTGALEILRKMGAGINLSNIRDVCGEPVADITVTGGGLTGTEICGDMIPALIDEIPVLAVIAALAEGETTVRDAAELRHKETDRIAAIVHMLTSLGANIEELPDGFIIRGGNVLRGNVCESFGDHRMAMAATVAGLSASGETTIRHADCVNISYPGFFDTLNSITVQ